MDDERTSEQMEEGAEGGGDGEEPDDVELRAEGMNSE